MASIGDVFLSLGLDDVRFQKEVIKAGQKAGDAAGRAAAQPFGKQLGSSLSAGLGKAGLALQGFGQKATSAGASITTGLTLPILGIGAAIVSVGRDYDTALRQIVGLTGVTKEEIGGINDAILELSTVVGKTPQELAEGFYFLASAGFTGKEALDVLKTSSMAAASGLGDTATIAQVVGAALNAFGKENLTAAHATDVLVSAVAEGTAEPAELASSLGTVLGTAGMLGAKFDEVAAAVAAMTLKGISASEASVALNQALVTLVKPTAQANAALEDAGLSAAGLRQQLKEQGLLSVLKTLSERLGDDETAIAAVFGNVRALKAILALTSGDLESTSALFERVADSSGMLEKAFEDTEGPGRDMDRAMAEMQKTLIALSSDVLPIVVEAFKSAASFISILASAFKALPAPVRSFIIATAGILAVTGPLLLVIGGLSKAFGGLFLGMQAAMKLGPKIAQMLASMILPSKALTGSLETTVADGIGGLKGSSKISRATQGLGRFLGSTLGKALSVGFAAIAVFEVFETYNRIKGELEDQTSEVAASAGKQLVTGTIEELKTGRAAIEAGLKQLPTWDFGLLSSGPRAELEKQLAAYDQAIAEKTRQAGLHGAEGTADGLTSGSGAVTDAASGLAEDAAAELDGLSGDAEAAGKNAALALAEGILADQSEVDSAFGALKDQAAKELTKTAEVAKLIGILTSKELADGLTDGRPGVRAQAENTRKVAEDRLAELGVRPGIYGKKAAQALADGLKSKDADVRAQAERTKGIVDTALSGASTKAKTAGETTATDYAKGLDQGRDEVDESARALARTVTNAFGPIIRNGFVVKVIGPSTAGNTRNRQHGGPVAPGRAYVVGETRPELFVPNVPGRIVPEVSMSSPVAAGDTVNVDVQVQGLLRARDPFEVATQLRRLADFGVLTPRREPA